MNIKRQRIKNVRLACIILSAFLMLMLLGEACSQAPSASKGPIKIGWLVPMTGPFTINGTEMTRGIKLAFDEVGFKVAGREIKMIEEDTEATPAVGVQKTRKVIESDKVNLISGITSTAVAYAIKEQVVAAGIPLIITNAAAADLTWKDAHPNIFRVSYTAQQQTYHLGSWAAKKYGWSKVSYIYADFAPAKEVRKPLEMGLATWDAKIVQDIPFPLNTIDYAPYLSKISKEANAVFAFTPADDQAIRFVKQWAELGLKDKMPLFAGGYLTHDDILPQMGDAALGIVTVFHYYPAIDTPENKKFVAAFRQKYNSDPAPWAYQGYMGGRVIIEALKTVKGNVEDTPNFLAALKKVEFTGPTGRFRFDDKNQAIVNAYLVKVEKVNGKLQNTILDEIRDVPQSIIYQQ